MKNNKTLLDKFTEDEYAYPLHMIPLFAPYYIQKHIFEEEVPHFLVYAVLVFLVMMLLFIIEKILNKHLTDYDIRSIVPVGFGSKNFYIYKNPTGLIEAIKIGWSWPACGFNSFWLLYKEIYAWFVPCAISVFLLPILPLPNYALLLSEFAIVYLFGTFGNQLLIHTFKEKGYKFALSVNADNAKSAKAQFVEHMNNSIA